MIGTNQHFPDSEGLSEDARDGAVTDAGLRRGPTEGIGPGSRPSEEGRRSDPSEGGGSESLPTTETEDIGPESRPTTETEDIGSESRPTTEAEDIGSESRPTKEWGRALNTVVAHLARAAESDPELASAIAVVARHLTGIAERPAKLRAAEEAAAADAAADDEATEKPAGKLIGEARLSIGGAVSNVAVIDVGSGAAAPPATAGRHAPVEPAAPPAEAPRPAAPPAVIIKRARLKADCCRWAIERRRRVDDAADFDLLIKPTDEKLAEALRALPDCYAWPLDPYVSLPEQRLLDDAAGCYDTLADAMDLAERTRGNEDHFEAYGQRIYELLAEACSALRKLLFEAGAPRDIDQDSAFDWLRSRVHEDHMYVARHMKLDDPADPGQWQDRRDEIEDIGSRIAQQDSHLKERNNLLGKIKYIANRWPDWDVEEALVQAGTLSRAINRLIELGMKPADRRLRDPLLMVADDLPESFTAEGSFREALRYADEYAARAEAEPRAPAQPPPPTAEVEKARQLLAGKVAVMIGGQCRLKSRDALQQGLNLQELRWVDTKPHEPLGHIEPRIRRDDVDIVLLAIRWSSHSYQELKAICDSCGKPFVRLPRGYGLNQVAAETLNQASAALDG